MVFLRLKNTKIMCRFRLVPDPLGLSSSPYGSLHLTVKSRNTLPVDDSLSFQRCVFVKNGLESGVVATGHFIHICEFLGTQIRIPEINTQCIHVNSLQLSVIDLLHNSWRFYRVQWTKYCSMVSHEPVNDWRTLDDIIVFPGDDQIQVWPPSCVEPFTCCFKPIDTSKSRNSQALGSFVSFT